MISAQKRINHNVRQILEIQNLTYKKNVSSCKIKKIKKMYFKVYLKISLSESYVVDFQ